MTRPRRALRGVRPTPTQLIIAARSGLTMYAAGVARSTSASITSTVTTGRTLLDPGALRSRTARLHRAEPRKELIRTGVAALAITALGLGAAGAMAATSSAINSADPAASTSASVSWPAFERRIQGTSRDAGRPDIQTAETKRAEELAAGAAKVSQAGQKAAINERAKELAGASTDTSKAARAMQTKQDQKEKQAKQEQAKQEQGKKVVPLDSYRIAAQFGAVGVWARYHTGTDFSAPLGTPIHSAAAGVVTHAGSGGEAGGWAGFYVVVRHADGYSTLYAHMNPALAVSVGQSVGAGELIGHVGLTGRTFGPHCHIELYAPGTTPGDVYSAINLMPWLNAG